MEEIFKDIPNYEGLYQVSNLGNVKSLSREILIRSKHASIIKEKILKPSINTTGYYFVNLYKNGKIKSFTIHKLVAITFLNHIPDGTTKIVVDHINNNSLDNRLKNLQLVSHRENLSKDKKFGSSQYVGVSWYKSKNKWISQIKINGKLKYLGLFSDELLAHEAYQNALKNL
jgi:hypothetical protein